MSDQQTGRQWKREAVFTAAVLAAGVAQAWVGGVTNHEWTLGGRHFSSPAVGRDGTIYVGSTNGCLYGLNPNGVTQHVWNTGNKIFASPSLGSDGTIYVGNDDGHLYAFNPDGTTQRVWGFSDRIVNSAAIGKDRTVYCAPQDGNLYALNPDSGATQQVWSMGSANRYTASSPSISTNGLIAIGGYSSNVYLFRPDGTTQTVWTITGTGGFDANPVFGSNNVAYIGDGGGYFYALDPDGSTQRVWQLPQGGFYSSAAIGSNGTIYVGSTSTKTNNFFAFNPNGTTQHVWCISNAAAGHVDAIYSSPAIGSDGTIYVGCDDGALYALNPDGTTNTIWQLSTVGYRIQSSPAIGPDGTVYIGEYDGNKFFALQGTGGRLANTVWPKFCQNMNNSDRLLTAPTNVAAIALTNERLAVVAWSMEPEATGYRVLRGTNPLPVGLTTVGVSTGLTIGDPTIKAGRSYYYWVKATNAVFTSGYSPAAALAVPAFPTLSAPAGVAASDGTYSDKVRVTWDLSSGATSYEVWRSSGTNPLAGMRLGEATAALYDDSTGTADALYYYSVKAKSAALTSAFGTPNSGYRYASSATLAPPAGVTASDGAYTNQVLVQWSAASGATSYEIWRHTANNELGAAVIGTTNDTTYSDTAASPDTVYYYWVTSRNVGGASAFGTADSGYRASASSATLSAPASVQASDGAYTDRVTLAWSAVTGAAGYQVWRAETNNTAGAALIGLAAGAGHTDTDITPAVRYYYWVKATNTTGASAFSVPDVGYGSLGSAASGQADLALTNLTFLPVQMTVGGTPSTVSVQLRNNGPAALTYPDSRVVADFYLSAGGVWGAADNQWIGEYRTDADLAAGATATLTLSPTAAAALAIPRGAAGAYHVFARISHTTPSTLADPNSANDVVVRQGAITVGVIESALPKNDFDGDGISDLALYQEATGAWLLYLSQSAQLRQQSFGANGYEALSGDFDGDGVYDTAIYQRTTGLWLARMSGSGGTVSAVFGNAGYRPIPADYDADDKTDPAVYGSASGGWYAMLSGRGYATVSALFGNASFTPVPADYDADGKADPAIYGAVSGGWYAMLSGSGYATVSALFGGADYVPVPADYDADGKADPALYHSATGQFIVLLSAGHYTRASLNTGLTGCSAVAGDYDGDGLADLALYLASAARWTVLLSGSGYAPQALTMGGAGYVPVK